VAGILLGWLRPQKKRTSWVPQVRRDRRSTIPDRGKGRSAEVSIVFGPADCMTSRVSCPAHRARRTPRAAEQTPCRSCMTKLRQLAAQRLAQEKGRGKTLQANGPWSTRPTCGWWDGGQGCATGTAAPHFFGAAARGPCAGILVDQGAPQTGPSSAAARGRRVPPRRPPTSASPRRQTSFLDIDEALTRLGRRGPPGRPNSIQLRLLRGDYRSRGRRRGGSVSSRSTAYEHWSLRSGPPQKPCWIGGGGVTGRRCRILFSFPPEQIKPGIRTVGGETGRGRIAMPADLQKSPRAIPSRRRQAAAGAVGTANVAQACAGDADLEASRWGHLLQVHPRSRQFFLEPGRPPPWGAHGGP